MHYALKRFELCGNEDFKKLLRDWKTYSETENSDIYGKKNPRKKEILKHMIEITYDDTTRLKKHYAASGV